MREKFALMLSQFNLGSLWQSNKVVWLLFLIFGTGSLLRIYGLGAESLWLDEATSVSYSSGSISSILDDPLARNNPPFYWILLHFWIGFFGTSEVALRSMSAVFGSLSIIIIYFLGKELFNQRVGLVVSALSAVSYFYIYYSQEARPYALLLLLSLLSYLLFVKILKQDRNWYYPSYFAVTLLLAYTHIYGLFVITSQIFYFLLFWGSYHKQGKKLLATMALTLLGMLPLLILLGLKAVRVMEHDGLWITQPTVGYLFDTFASYAGTGEARHVLYLAFFVLALLGLFKVKKISGMWNWRRILQSFEHFRWEVKLQPVDVSILLLIWLSFSVIIPFLASQVITPFYIIRYTIGASPAFYLLVAKGMGTIERKRLLYSLLVIVIILSSLGIYRYYVLDVKEQWREVANLVESSSSQGDAIVICASYCQIPFDYYYQGDLSRSGISKNADTEEITTFVAEVTADKDRLWLLLSHGGKYGLIEDYLRNEYDDVPLEYKFAGVRVFLFDLAPSPDEPLSVK